MISTLIATAMLFASFIEGLPYGYFQILRWVVCGTCIYRVFLCHESEQKKCMWVFVTIGILFNPIIPVHLNREIWLVVDGGVGIGLLASLVLLKKTEYKKE